MVDIPAAPNLHNFYTLLRNHPAKLPTVTYAPDEVVLFQYTGGTTGTPKAAMLTHHNLMSNLKQIRAWFNDIIPGKEKILGTLPYFHVYGMTCGVLFGPEIGAELIMSPDPRNTELVIQMIGREHVTLYPGVPAMYNAILNHPLAKQINLHSVKECLSGGAPLPGEVVRQFETMTGGRLVEGYGLSESSPVAVANPLRGETARWLDWASHPQYGCRGGGAGSRRRRQSPCCTPWRGRGVGDLWAAGDEGILEQS